MTRGVVKRQFEQMGYPPIVIKILGNSEIVIFEQDDNRIYVRFPYMDEFVYETNEVKRWTKPKKEDKKW